MGYNYVLFLLIFISSTALAQSFKQNDNNSDGVFYRYYDQIDIPKESLMDCQPFTGRLPYTTGRGNFSGSGFIYRFQTSEKGYELYKFQKTPLKQLGSYVKLLPEHVRHLTFTNIEFHAVGSGVVVFASLINKQTNTVSHQLIKLTADLKYVVSTELASFKIKNRQPSWVSVVKSKDSKTIGVLRKVTTKGEGPKFGKFIIQFFDDELSELNVDTLSLPYEKRERNIVSSGETQSVTVFPYRFHSFKLGNVENVAVLVGYNSGPDITYNKDLLDYQIYVKSVGNEYEKVQLAKKENEFFHDCSMEYDSNSSLVLAAFKSSEIEKNRYRYQNVFYQIDSDLSIKEASHVLSKKEILDLVKIDSLVINKIEKYYQESSSSVKLTAKRDKIDPVISPIKFDNDNNPHVIVSNQRTTCSSPTALNAAAIPIGGMQLSISVSPSSQSSVDCSTIYYGYMHLRLDETNDQMTVKSYNWTSAYSRMQILHNGEILFLENDIPFNYLFPEKRQKYSALYGNVLGLRGDGETFLIKKNKKKKERIWLDESMQLDDGTVVVSKGVGKKKQWCNLDLSNLE